MIVVLSAVAFGQQRIAHGTDALAGEFPEVVFMQNDGACTATMIHPRWALTAAHCFDNIDLSTVQGDGRILFGNAGSGAPFITFDQTFLPPTYASQGFSPNTDLQAHRPIDDVALIRLDSPADTPIVRLNHAPVHDHWYGTELMLLGFGNRGWDQSGSGTLRFGVGTLDQLDAEGRVLFVPGPSGSESTPTDAGGPAWVYDADGPIQVSVISTHSWEVQPATHADIATLLGWITETLAAFGDTIDTADATPPAVACDPIGTEPPVEVRCDVSGPNADAVREVEWTWGDGAVTEGLEGTHTFVDEGLYEPNARIAWGPEEYSLDHHVSVGTVLACEPPEVAFDATETGRNRYALENRTASHLSCVTQMRWSVFEGDSDAGEPILTLEDWEPVLDLNAFGRGTYTVKLDVGGPSGQGAATLTLESTGCGCSSTTNRTWLDGWARRR